METDNSVQEKAETDNSLEKKIRYRRFSGKQCTCIIKSGKNKGQQCKNFIKEIPTNCFTRCWKHLRQKSIEKI